MSSCLEDNLKSFHYTSLAIQFADVPREIGGGVGKFFLWLEYRRFIMPFKIATHLHNSDSYDDIFWWPYLGKWNTKITSRMSAELDMYVIMHSSNSSVPSRPSDRHIPVILTPQVRLTFPATSLLQDTEQDSSRWRELKVNCLGYWKWVHEELQSGPLSLACYPHLLLSLYSGTSSVSPKWSSDELRCPLACVPFIPD